MSDLRMPSTNVVVISGRLTRDAEVKYISSGKAVCNLSIANSRPFKDKQGERQEDTSFVEVTCWDKLAEWCSDYKKGRPVMIEGRLKSNTWEDKETGKKRSNLGVVAQSVTLLDWDGDRGESRPTSQSRPAATNQEEIPQDDDIPF